MKTARLLAPAAIVLAGLLAYSSAFPGAFVFDDAPHISRNPQLDRPLRVGRPSECPLGSLARRNLPPPRWANGCGASRWGSPPRS